MPLETTTTTTKSCNTNPLFELLDASLIKSPSRQSIIQALNLLDKGIYLNDCSLCCPCDNFYVLCNTQQSIILEQSLAGCLSLECCINHSYYDQNAGQVSDGTCAYAGGENDFLNCLEILKEKIGIVKFNKLLQKGFFEYSQILGGTTICQIIQEYEQIPSYNNIFLYWFFDILLDKGVAVYCRDEGKIGVSSFNTFLQQDPLYIFGDCIETICFQFDSADNGINPDEFIQLPSTGTSTLNGKPFYDLGYGRSIYFEGETWVYQNTPFGITQLLIPPGSSSSSIHPVGSSWSEAGVSGTIVSSNYGLCPNQNCPQTYLYNHFAISDERQLAPPGWRVPTLAEWQTLFATESNQTYAFIDPLGWLKDDYYGSPIELTNTTGLSLRWNGYRRSDGTFDDDYYGHYWTNNPLEVMTLYGCCGDWYDDNGQAIEGRAIRFIKEDDNDTGTVTGNDGKVYPTVKIGNQVWMAADLQETQYRNGDPIPNVTNNQEWSNLSTGARSTFNNAIACNTPVRPPCVYYRVQNESATESVSFEYKECNGNIIEQTIPPATYSSFYFCGEWNSITILSGELYISYERFCNT